MSSEKISMRPLGVFRRCVFGSARKSASSVSPFSMGSRSLPITQKSSNVGTAKSSPAAHLRYMCPVHQLDVGVRQAAAVVVERFAGMQQHVADRRDRDERMHRIRTLRQFRQTEA